LKLKCDTLLSTFAFKFNLRRYTKAYPLNELLHDCEQYFVATGRRVTFEYTLLGGRGLHSSTLQLNLSRF
jgi:hypothetical protein